VRWTVKTERALREAEAAQRAKDQVRAAMREDQLPPPPGESEATRQQRLHRIEEGRQRVAQLDVETRRTEAYAEDERERVAGRTRRKFGDEAPRRRREVREGGDEGHYRKISTRYTNVRNCILK
jgi:hypothetical protein